MNTCSYFFDDGKSRKFWKYKLRGKKLTFRYGRLGTQGRETSKSFSSASDARAATIKLANQKVAKGYIPVEPDRLKITRLKRMRAATEAQVAKLERLLETTLPSDYRNFLLSQNGGQPKPDHIVIPFDSGLNSISVGYIYGLYAKPEPFKGLLFAVDKVLPCLPEGHFPICGLFNLHYFSLSLDQNPGYIYFWDEDAGGYDVDEDGQTVFNESHAILVASSFNEFLTRIAIHEVPEEDGGPASIPADEPFAREIPELRSGKRLSQSRRREIIRLVDEGGDELTAVMEQGEVLMRKKSRKAGEALIDKFLRQIGRETKKFLKTTTSKHELQYFAENVHWDANTRPLLELVKNPHIDAGTLLQLYWFGCPEDYYLFYKLVSDIDSEFERYVFRVLRHIERRIVKSEYKTASISFDPTSHISMWDRRDEFARKIPDILYQPISSRRKCK